MEENPTVHLVGKMAHSDKNCSPDGSVDYKIALTRRTDGFAVQKLNTHLLHTRRRAEFAGRHDG